MLELIKEAGTILKDLPDLAIWILVGILFYKTIIIGSIFGVIKLAIAKWHDYLSKRLEQKLESTRLLNGPKEIIKEFEWRGKFITNDETTKRLDVLISTMHTGSNIRSQYIHRSDIDYAIEAINEKRKRDEEKVRDIRSAV